MEAQQNEEWVNKIEAVGSESLEERVVCSLVRTLDGTSKLNVFGCPEGRFVCPRRVLPGGTVTMHQEAMVPDGLNECCKGTGMSLFGD